MKSIAIMQPYFIPYAGYFRLMQSVDTFVIYDCVQFTRRGYIHRNKVHDKNNILNWLTLPLEKQNREIRISQLKFRNNALTTFKNSFVKSKIFDHIKEEKELLELIYNFDQSPSQYIVNLLKYFCKLLNIETNFSFSSKLNLPTTLKGQDRILAICDQLKASHYINSPNGRSLYNSISFNEKSVELHFLNEYNGEYISILEDLYLKNINQKSNLIDSIKKQSFY